MGPVDAEAASIECLPVEIVTKVLEYLPAIDQMQSKRVCRMWHHVLTDRDEYWRRRCARDFADTYEHAHSKCHPPLTWGQLYHSLHLWTKLDVAKETWTKILYSNDHWGLIRDIYLYKDTMMLRINYPKGFDKIHYLDKYTHKAKNVIVLYKNLEYDGYSIYGYSIYVEAKSGILKIYEGNYDNLSYDIVTCLIKNVHDYVIVDSDLYYSVCNGIDLNKIFVRKCSNNYNSSTEFITAPLPIKGLSYYENNLHVLVENNRVFKVVENQLVHVKDEHHIYTLLLYGFQLIDHCSLDCYWSPKTRREDFGSRIAVLYNNLIFSLDYYKGVLSVYNNDALARKLWLHRPSDPSDIEAAIPVKVYELSGMLQGDVDLISIDVLEKENGHTVYVVTETKILSLDLDH